MNKTAVVEIVLAYLITQADFLNKLLGTKELTFAQWGLGLLAAVGLLLRWELGKLIAAGDESTDGGFAAGARTRPSASKISAHLTTITRSPSEAVGLWAIEQSIDQGIRDLVAVADAAEQG